MGVAYQRSALYKRGISDPVSDDDPVIQWSGNSWHLRVLSGGLKIRAPIFRQSLREKTRWNLGNSAFGDGDPGEEFLVSVGAGDGRGDDAVPVAGELRGDEFADFLHGALVEQGIPDDAAAGDVLAAEFELRLDEADDGAAAFEHGEDGG